VLCQAAWAQAQSVPQPPCGSDPFPQFPDLAGSPVVKVWNQLDWIPPACVGWAATPPSTLVVTVGRFRNPAGVEALRRRIGAVSQMSGMLYWSTTKQQWQPQIVNAYALAGPSSEEPRKDFGPDEIVEELSFYVLQEDNLLGKLVYRIRIANASAGRLVITSENSSTVRYLGLPIFAPGDLRSICFLDRESAGIWRYYGIARMGKQVSLLAAGHDASLINRAVASYRYLAGIPGDQEPPAAR